MKVIDFLNKIAKGELEDTKFEYDGDCFKYYKSNQQIDRYEDDTYTTVEYYNDSIFMCSNLNDEVEIIEEEKDIEKISNEHDSYCYTEYDAYKHEVDKVLYILRAINSVNDRISDTNNKINELVREVNKLKHK